MRFRTGHIALLLLLLSSLAVIDARAGTLVPARTPGGVFVRNLLLRAAVEESDPVQSTLRHKRSADYGIADVEQAPGVPQAAGPGAWTAHVHAVTGNSL